MYSLDYTAYDPIFYLHHSNVDRIWAIWQALQKYRGLPFDSADCALNELADPMEPFNMAINTDSVTKEHAEPNTVTDLLSA
jgi:hypothetical protein